MTTMGSKRFVQVLESIFGNSPSKMSKATDLNLSTIFRCKTGRRPPTERVMRAISRATNLKLSWLMGGGNDEMEYDPPKDREKSCLRPILPFAALFSAEDSTAESEMRFRQVKPCHFRSDLVWVKANTLNLALQISPEDYLLIQTVKPRKLLPSDLKRMLIIVKNNEFAQLRSIEAADIADKDILVGGVVLLIERDVQAASAKQLDD